MEKKITLYVAKQKIWGTVNVPHYIYFRSLEKRNAFVKATDYTEKAGTVKVTYDELHYEMAGICDVR